MSLKSLTFEASESSLATLDEIAKGLGETREYVLREAFAQYIAEYEGEKAIVAEADRQFEAGETVSHEEVVAKFLAWKAANVVREAA